MQKKEENLHTLNVLTDVGICFGMRNVNINEKLKVLDDHQAGNTLIERDLSANDVGTAFDRIAIGDGGGGIISESKKSTTIATISYCMTSSNNKKSKKKLNKKKSGTIIKTTTMTNTTTSTTITTVSKLLRNSPRKCNAAGIFASSRMTVNSCNVLCHEEKCINVSDVYSKGKSTPVAAAIDIPISGVASVTTSLDDSPRFNSIVVAPPKKKWIRHYLMGIRLFFII